jgi:hypothetical protein
MVDINPIANQIEVENEDLQSWADSINFKIDVITNTAVFSGICYDNSDIIPIPFEAQEISVPPNKPFLYKNGKLIDPSLVSFVGPCPTTIQLTGDAILNNNDNFIIFIRP